MKKLLTMCAVLAMTLFAGKAMAADVTGSWTATMQGQDGNPMTLTFNFKQDGAALTGTVASPFGDPMPITNGKIDGDKFTFDVSFNGMTIHHDCTVNGDEIHLTSKSDSGDFPGIDLTLKRVKAGDAPAAPAPAAPAPPTGATATPQPQLF